MITTEADGPGHVGGPTGLAVDTSGNLYVADVGPTGGGQILRGDAQERWTVIATEGDGSGQVAEPNALAGDTAGNLYVADLGVRSGNIYGRIQKRDVQGFWSVIATAGSAPGQVSDPVGDTPLGLAVDAAGNLYVADTGNNRMLEYTPDDGQ